MWKKVLENWPRPVRVFGRCGLSRSNYYRSVRASLESRRIRKEVLELSAKHPRYG